MGNVVTLSSQLVSTSSYHCISASSPEELEAKAQAFISSLVGGAVGISDYYLSGTGDGLEFALCFVLSTATAAPGADAEAICWAGQGDTEFTRNANAAFARATQAQDIALHAVAGSSKGLRRMGFILTTS